MALLACPAVLTEPHNWTTGGQCPASDDANVTAETAYNADGNVSSITAVNATTGNQTTQYVYGITPADSEIATAYEVRGMRAKIYQLR